jgi:hypothetical protein
MSARHTAIHRCRGLRRLQQALIALGALLLSAILIALVVDRIFFGSSSSSSSSPAGTGSGVAATQARSLPPFTGLELASGNNVIVQVGASQSVIVHGDSNLLRRVTTRVRSGRLVIGTIPGNISAKTPMFVTVSVPSLNRVRLQGAGNISLTGINSPSLTVALPGSGNIDATGTTMKLNVTISGEGNALLRQLVARDAKAVISGDGSIVLTAAHSLSARVSGSGAVVYSGNPPHLTQRVTGSGTISPG